MPPREVTFVQDHYYHIYNRGVARQSIFRETDNYLFFLRRLKKCAHDLNVSVIAYCLLPNHYHLLVRQDGFEPAGLLPQRCCNSYAKAFNKRYGRTGALFEDRYQAIEVDSEAYLLQVCRYIHANPVRHGLASQLGESGPSPIIPNGLACATASLSIGHSSRRTFRQLRSTATSCRRTLSDKTICRLN